MTLNNPIEAYKAWKERDTTFNLILDIIYRLNRGGEGTLESHLKSEYKKLKENGEVDNQSLRLCSKKCNEYI